MESFITAEEIQRCKDYLKEHPIDHAYDEEAEMLDGKIPRDQYIARLCYSILEQLGEIE